MKAKHTPWAIYLRNGLGRRLSIIGQYMKSDWLIYNPFVMRQFHDEAIRNAALVVPVILELFGTAKSVLDVGCGSGAFTAEFTRYGLKAVGLERSPYGESPGA